MRTLKSQDLTTRHQICTDKKSELMLMRRTRA